LNKLGWACILQERLEEARVYLMKAIERSRQVQDYYQLVESLTDLAVALDGLGRFKEAEALLQEADDIAAKFNYNYLLGLAQLARGESEYNAGEYEKAFHHYSLFCYYTALYNPVEHGRAVRKTINDLLAIPQRHIPEILSVLAADWASHEQELGARAQLLVSSLEEVRTLLGT
jgi:tetratricopeptide (TPR) repeat protein